MKTTGSRTNIRINLKRAENREMDKGAFSLHLLRILSINRIKTVTDARSLKIIIKINLRVQKAL